MRFSACGGGLKGGADDDEELGMLQCGCGQRNVSFQTDRQKHARPPLTSERGDVKIVIREDPQYLALRVYDRMAYFGQSWQEA